MEITRISLVAEQTSAGGGVGNRGAAGESQAKEYTLLSLVCQNVRVPANGKLHVNVTDYK